MEQTIEIDEKEHITDLMKNLDSARMEERLCDVTIKVGSKTIPCHKIVLSEGCDFFKGMFAHRMKETESGIAEMDGVGPECMMMCVQFIYTGKVSIPGGKVLELLQVAHMLQLTKLCDRIASYLEKRLDAESFFATRKIVRTLNLKRMEKTYSKFAMKNFHTIASMDEFNELEKEYLIFLIGSKETEADESIKCKALLVWSKSDVENRTKIFEEIFLSLDFTKLPKEYISYLVDKEELVFNSNSCLRWILRTASGLSDVNSRDVDFKGSAESKVKGGAASDSGNNAIAVFNRTSNTLQAFNPEEKTYNVIKSLSEDFIRNSFSAVVVGDDIYVLADDKTNYKLSYRDPNASWVRLPDRTSALRVDSVALDGAIYALSNGFCSESKSIEKFDLTSSTWSNVCDEPARGSESAIVAAGDFIYCIGGVAEDYLNSMIRFGPRSGTWGEMPHMPTKRCGAAAVHLDANIYVVGGRVDCGYLAANECFDTVSRNWTSLTGLRHRRLIQACAVRGRIYVTGELSENAIVEYDPPTDKWKVVEMMRKEDVEARASVALKL